MIHYPSATPEGGPAGRGGWLLFVAAGLAYTVIALPFSLLEEWLPWLLDPQTWTILADPIAHGFHPSFPAYVLFYLLIAVLIGFAALVGLVLFARRSPEFPKYMIWYYLGSFTLRLAVLIVEEEMWPYGVTTHSVTAGEAVIAMLWALPGVPYIARSRRVKNTFTRRAAPESASPPA